MDLLYWRRRRQLNPANDLPIWMTIPHLTYVHVQMISEARFSGWVSLPTGHHRHIASQFRQKKIGRFESP
jgi:hypothetical protein